MICAHPIIRLRKFVTTVVIAGFSHGTSVACQATLLEEVQVTAQRNLLGQALTDGAVVHAINAESQASPNRTIGDWIEHLPGVSLNGQGGLFQSYSIRGFSRWRVRTEIDGVPIITDRRAGSTASFLPPGLAGRATISLGPGSSIYGSGAMGGVVSITTITPTSPTVGLSAQTNDNATATTLTTASGGFSAGISFRDAKNAGDPDHKDLNTGYRQFAGVFKSDFEQAGFDIALSWLPSMGRDIGKSAREFPNLAVSNYPRETHSILNVRLTATDRWLAQVYHHFQDRENITQRLDEPLTRTDYTAHTIGGLFYAGTNWGTGSGRVGIEWIGRRGADIRDRRVMGIEKRVIATQTIDGESDTVAGFVDQHWRSDDWSWGGGLRFDSVMLSDRHRDRSDTNLSGSANIAWQASSQWRFNAALGTAFRFPALTELYFTGSTPRGDTFGNPNLSPETNRSTQLGVSFAKSQLRCTTSWYYTRLRNYIERFQVAPGQYSYRNLQAASIWGMEATLDWASSARWQHTLYYQWQKGEDRDGNWLADLNPSTLRYLGVYRSRSLIFHNDVTYRFARDNFGEEEQTLASAITWNARLSRDFGKHWRGEIYVNNILNKSFLATADNQAPLQPGRTLGFSFRWSRDP